MGDFGSRDWIRAVLTDFKAHFAPFKNATDPKVAEELLANSEMADWSETNKAALKDPANKESLAALVEFLAAQSGRTDQARRIRHSRPRDVLFLNRGNSPKARFQPTASIAMHSIFRSEKKSLGTEGAAPLLTGYGGADWLKRFITDPGLPANYGKHNHMPAFKTRLSDRELDLLVRWMTGDYFRPAPESEPTKTPGTGLAARP